MLKNKKFKIFACAFTLMLFSTPNLISHNFINTNTVSAASIGYTDKITGHHYSIDTVNQEAKIYGTASTNQCLIIPENITINGFTYPVTSIATGSFIGKNFTEVVIGKNVEVIKFQAFSGCTSLDKIVFKYPEKRRRVVYEEVFKGCPANTVLFTDISGNHYYTSHFNSSSTYMSAVDKYILETSENYKYTYIFENSFDNNRNTRSPRVVRDPETNAIKDDYFWLKMAHNIYSDPVIASNIRKYNTLSIDFKGVKTPQNTYWALFNFGMDLSNFNANAEGGGAYAGLQNRDDGRKAIMSFWEISYTENGVEKKLRANRVYPSGEESNFGNEGEGNNLITGYNWEDNKWYRMVLHSWTDFQSGNTMVGQWFKDIENNKWTLISIFDTNMRNSSLVGNLSQFQENYLNSCSDLEREFNIKNLYCRELNTNNWLSLKSSILSSSAKYADDTSKKGLWEFGSGTDYFWGKAGGLVTDQYTYNQKPQDTKYTIQQNNLPSIDPIILLNNTVNFKRTQDRFLIDWEYADNSSPQLSYEVSIVNNGATLFKKAYSMPNSRNWYCDLKRLKTGPNTITIKFTDIFGQTKTASHVYIRS